MLAYWQEILTLIIVALAVWFLLKRYVFKPAPVKGAGAEACAPCSLGSCDGCAVMDLKKEIDAARFNRSHEPQPSDDPKASDQWKQKLEQEILLREKKLK